MTDHSKFIIRARAVILHEQKLLVVKHRPEADYYALPGGHMDPGETPQECVKREIMEELGITPELGRLLYVHTFRDKGVVDTVEFFFEVTNGVEYLLFEDEERTHAFELAEVRWVSKEDNIILLPKRLGEDFKGGTLLSQTTRYSVG